MWERASASGEDRERGVALILVIGVGALLAVLASVAVGVVLGGMRQARSDQDWNAAMAAAHAGLEEYRSRLTEDAGYPALGNPGSPFSVAGSVTLPEGSARNPAFDVGPEGDWAEVPSSGGRAWFRYEVDSSAYDTDGAEPATGGTLWLRSTGKVGDATRTLVATLAPAEGSGPEEAPLRVSTWVEVGPAMDADGSWR